MSRQTNRALLRHVLLPTIFLTVALLGGVRVAADTRALMFVPPPLVTLILAAMLLALFARGGAVRVGHWLSADRGAAENVSHALVLGSLFFASAQAFNSVLPDAGLPRLVLASFFLWTLWQNQFSQFDARRLLRSLAALFGTAFAVKHLLLASVTDPEGGWLRRLTASVLEGVALGGPAYAASTGYISFFALALYVCGLYLLPPSSTFGNVIDENRAAELAQSLRLLPARERALVIEELNEETEKVGTLTEPVAGE
jgi:hypothetical protein